MAEGGCSGASRAGPKRKRSTRAFQRPMLARKPEPTARRSQAASAEPAATVTSSRRRVISLGTFPSSHHLDDGARMQDHHDEVNECEESKQTEADQMDRAGTIVAAEKDFEP